jgi:lysophospholipase L1-like esterase
MVNNYKYRDPLIRKNPTKTNIAFVGDSVTWGFGTTNEKTTYPNTFEDIYNHSSSKQILVNNFGTPGYNFDQEYLLIKEKILPEYQPDVIVWNLNVNDIWESNYSCLFTFKDNQWTQISARKNIHYWYGIIKTYFPKIIVDSRLFDFLWQQVNKKLTNYYGGGNYTFGCSTANFTLSVKQQIINKLDFFITDLNNEFQKRNIKLIVTIVPYQELLDSDLSYSQINPDYFALENYLSANNSVNFLDFNQSVPKTKNNINPADEYFLDGSNDTAQKGWRHPNQKMYDLMAKALVEYLKQNQLTL